MSCSRSLAGIPLQRRITCTSSGDICELSSVEGSGGWGTQPRDGHRHRMVCHFTFSVFVNTHFLLFRFSSLFFPPPSFCDRFHCSFSAHAFFFSVSSPCGFSLCSASCVLSEGGCGMGGGRGEGGGEVCSVYYYFRGYLPGASFLLLIERFIFPFFLLCLFRPPVRVLFACDE